MTIQNLTALARRRALAALFALATGGASGVVAQQPAPATPPVVIEIATEQPTAPVTEAPCGDPMSSPFAGAFLERSKLTGNWFGLRDTLADHGITWNISSTNFYQGVASGGADTGFRYGGRADYLLNVDGEKAGLWKGLFVTLHGETLFGQSANSLTGALLPTSLAQTLPVTDPNGGITVLSGVKVTQALSENFITYFGKLNTADDFNQPFTGGARGVNGFMNAGMVLPPVLARTIPYSTFGGGFAVLKDKQPIFTLGVFDTNNTPTVSGFDTFFNNGASVNAQVNIPTNFLGMPGHQSVGGVYSSAQYTSLNGLPYFVLQRLRGEVVGKPKVSGSWATYYLFDQTLWADDENPKRSWGMFGSAGISDGDANPIKWSGSIGLGGASPFCNRPLDSFGVGYFYIGMSNSLTSLAPRLLRLGDEQGVELFYNIGVTPWCHITPDLQIINPIRERVDTSVNFGIRAKIDF
ncbi:carbohydrate porin [Zavarzinella formosa]|uniref:carbohydrate porin n=1 Tax=Zavarzinella formosa TaxID=360055 RepID=UPI0002EBE47E|nr:carbohydrate porin [Zavarzinella formosa]